MSKAFNKVTWAWLDMLPTTELVPVNDWIVDPVFDDEARAFNVGPKYWTYPGGSNVHVMTEGEIEAFDLPFAKEEAAGQIDEEIERRIKNGTGFEFPPGSGQFFSMSTNAQIKWIAMSLNLKINSYPMRVPTIDNSSFYDAPNDRAVTDMYEALVAKVNLHLGDGTVAKQLVNAAGTCEQVRNIVAAYMG